jgi:hypothetical protein
MNRPPGYCLPAGTYMMRLTRIGLGEGEVSPPAPKGTASAPGGFDPDLFRAAVAPTRRCASGRRPELMPPA